MPPCQTAFLQWLTPPLLVCPQVISGESRGVYFLQMNHRESDASLKQTRLQGMNQGSKEIPAVLGVFKHVLDRGGLCIAQCWALPSCRRCLLRAGPLHQSPGAAGCRAGAAAVRAPHPAQRHRARGGWDSCWAGVLSIGSRGSRGDGRVPAPARRTPSPGAAGWAAPAPCPGVCAGGRGAEGELLPSGREGASARDPSSPRGCFAATPCSPGARVLTNSGKVWGRLSEPDTDVL